MANTFTAVIDKIFARSLLALRGATTLPRLVRTDWSEETAQQGDTINVPLPPDMIVDDVTPGAVPPAGQNVTRNVVPIVLNKWRKTEMHLTDKEAREIADGARAGDVSVAMSVLADDVNGTLMDLHKDIYGFAGTAGVTPFATDLSDATAARRVLFDQKAPKPDRSIIVDGAAEENALNLRQVFDQSFKNGEGENTQISGEIGAALGFRWAADQQVKTHTNPNGTPTGFLVNQVGHAVGDSTVTVDTGANDPVAGDVFTVAGDTQTYVVKSFATNVITFAPAAKTAFADNAALTFKAAHVANLAFQRDAFALATRPLEPADGFAGGSEIRSEMDPATGIGITLEVSRQHMRTMYQWSILYGVKTLRAALASRIAG